MSEEAVSDFFERLKDDNALASEYNAKVSRAIVPAILDVAARHGYDFTSRELGKYLKNKPHELSEQELESVSAGGPFTSGMLTNPWVIGGLITAAIAVPLALDDQDDGS
jgi:predicted ribosomally synthesized peptide with nif11-like leader